MLSKIKSEFKGEICKTFENPGIASFKDLKEYSVKKGFEYSENLDNRYRTIVMKKGTVEISVPIQNSLPVNEFTLSIILGIIREKLSKAKHSEHHSRTNQHYLR
jgi:hypothetical protein